MLAITMAKKIGDWRLNECKLFVTKEPCPMCAGATVIARIKEVFFAFKDPKMGALGGATALQDLPKSNHKPLISSGIMRDECLEMTQTFFRLRRNK